MSKKEDKFSNIALGMVIGAAIIIVLLCIIITGMREGDTKAQRYDLSCTGNLLDCKE